MAHRASFVLREKGLAFEPKFFEVGKRPPELEAVGPYAKSPTLFDGDVRVWDSPVVIEYLEDRTPQPALLPKDAAGRAQVRMLMSRVSELAAKQGALVMELQIKPPAERDASKIEEAKKGAVVAMKFWDAQLAQKDFLLRDSLTLADVMLYTLLPAFESLAEMTIPSELGNLRAWYERLSARPSSKPLTP